MRRRRVLASGFALLSGCIAAPSADEPTPETPTDTRTPIDTPTPTEAHPVDTGPSRLDQNFPCPSPDAASWQIRGDETVCSHALDGDESVVLEPETERVSLGDTLTVTMRTDQDIGTLGPFYWDILGFDLEDGWTSVDERGSVEELGIDLGADDTYEWTVRVGVEAEERGDAPYGRHDAGGTAAFRPGVYAFVVDGPSGAPADAYAALFEVVAGEEPPMPSYAGPSNDDSPFTDCQKYLHCYHDADPDARVYVEPEREVVELGDELAFTVWNWSSGEVSFGPYHWDVKRRTVLGLKSVDEREAVPDLGAKLGYGDSWTIEGDVTASASDGGSGLTDAVSFEPGIYRFEYDLYRNDLDKTEEWATYFRVEE